MIKGIGKYFWGENTLYCKKGKKISVEWALTMESSFPPHMLFVYLLKPIKVVCITPILLILECTLTEFDFNNSSRDLRAVGQILVI